MTETQLKRSVLWVTIFASFLTPFMGSAVNLALPAISEDFHLNAVSLNWVISSYMLTTSIFLLPAGRAGDILGRRKVFSIGVMIFTLSMVALTLSTHFAWLIGARIVQGIGGAMMFGTNMAILTSVFPPGERGKAMGINVTAVYTGLASGPFRGRPYSVFGVEKHICGPGSVGIVSWILLQTKVKQEWAEAKGERFDWLGAILYGLSIASLMYGVSVIFTIQGKVLIAVGAVLVPLFLWREKKASYPLFDMSLLSHNRVFAFSSMAALIHYAATSAVAFFLSLYLQYMKGLGARDAGFVLMASPIMMALLSSSAGKLSDRYNPGVLASLGMGLTSMGLVVLAFISERTSVALIVGTLAIMGIGFALFSSPNSNAIMSSVEKRQLGNASGMLGTMRNVGQTSSMAIALLLLALYMGRESIQPSNYALFMNSMKTGFVIFLVLCILGVMASLARNKSLQK